MIRLMPAYIHTQTDYQTKQPPKAKFVPDEWSVSGINSVFSYTIKPFSYSSLLKSVLQASFGYKYQIKFTTRFEES